MRFFKYVWLTLVLTAPTLSLADSVYTFQMFSGRSSTVENAAAYTTSPTATILRQQTAAALPANLVFYASRTWKRFADTGQIAAVTGTNNTVPEPGTLAMFGAGLIGLFGMRRVLLH